MVPSSLNYGLIALCRWDYFMPVYNCATQEKLGIVPRLGDNGKWTCGVRSLLQKEGCIVYSFGSNGETSYEEDVLAKTACEVHTFDPTLSPQQEASVLAVPGINLHKVGLAAEPGQVRCTVRSCIMSFAPAPARTALVQQGSWCGCRWRLQGNRAWAGTSPASQ